MWLGYFILKSIIAVGMLDRIFFQIFPILFLIASFLSHLKVEMSVFKEHSGLDWCMNFERYSHNFMFTAHKLILLDIIISFLSR